MIYDGFIGPCYESQSATVDQERTVNFYLERTESTGATTRAALYPTPGVEQITGANYGPGRAHFFENGREFAVEGSGFFEIDVDAALTGRGVVAINSSPATISSNGDGGGQLFITSGGNGYIFDLDTNVFTQITALDGKATMGAHLDGYFLALDAATSTFYVSELYDGLTWNTGTMFAQRSAAPDPWSSLATNGRYIWLLGQQTSEVWYNSGSASFPFALHPSGLVPFGIAAPFSVDVADGSIIWLAASRVGNGAVMRATGLTPEVVSTYPLQKAFNGYDTISDAIADTYTDLGHTFYLLTFPTEEKTWAWDVQLGQWAERATWISEEGRYTAWRPQWHAMAFGEHRMLDSVTPAIYRMSSDYFTDVEGREIRRLRRAPCLMDEMNRVFYSSFELDLEPGLGLTAIPVVQANPQVMLRISNDGGKTWGNEMWRAAGAIGQFNTRVRWTRLGTARRRVFEVVVSDFIPWRLAGAYLGLAQAPASARRAS